MHKRLNLPPQENCPSGKCSPVFTWSPLPARNKLKFTDKKFAYNIDKNKINCYPNCDVNVWLRSCEEEIKEPLVGSIKGQIPLWLKGSLLRNGPGSLKAGNDQFKHLFDSSALIHRFNINNGLVTYQCKFLKTNVYKQNWTANRIVVSEFGTQAVPDPCHTIFDRVASFFNPQMSMSDNAMISLYPFGDEIYAFGEVPIIHKIDVDTLNTEKQVDLTEHVTIVHHSSHPHVTANGDVYNLAMSVTMTGPHFNIVRFPIANSDSSDSAFKQAEIVASIPTRWPLHPSYMHTFGMTDNYFLIIEQPLTLSASGIISTRLKNEPLASCFRWYQDEYTQINVISRKTGKLVAKFFSEAFFYLHIINQFEMSNHIVVDICMYRDPAMLDCMYVETMKDMQYNPDYAKMFRGRPARYVLPLDIDFSNVEVDKNLVKLNGIKAKAYLNADNLVIVKPEKLCNLGCETPRIYYEKYLGKCYRYFYAISSDVDADFPGKIIKVDILTKTTKTWYEDNCYPSEPIFVSSPDPKSEDDGVILAAMVWGGNDTNHVGIIIIDAISFEEIGRAEFFTPSPVPKCLHGWFVHSS